MTVAASIGASWCAQSIPPANETLLERSIDSADALVVTLYAVTVWITSREGATNRSVQLDSERLLTIAPS